MKSSCVITIKLNTLTDVPYQMMVGGAFATYVKTCERGRVKDFEQRSRVYNAFFPVDPDNRVIMESQCSDKKTQGRFIKKLKISTHLTTKPTCQGNRNTQFSNFHALI